MAAASLYDILGVSPKSSTTEIKRAFKTLRTKAHPDKPEGNADTFNALVEAHAVLTDPAKRKHYDATGQVHKGADVEFMETFAGGSFKSPAAAASKPAPAHKLQQDGARAASMADAITVRQQDLQAQSHSAGLEAWMRSRSSTGLKVYDADAIAQEFGVVRSSYDAVPLPHSLLTDSACVALSCSGRPAAASKDGLASVLSLHQAALPQALEWGEVLVELVLAPVSPADVYSVSLGGVYGEEVARPPFVVGHDGVGIVRKVGPGVKTLQEGEAVLPMRTFASTWRSHAVWPAKDLLLVGAAADGGEPGGDDGTSNSTDAGSAKGRASDLMLPWEYLAVSRELCTAYRLLEEHGDLLKPGDCIIINAANSTVGQALLQLARLLRLRTVALLRDDPRQPGYFAKASARLSALGVTHVMLDEGPIKPRLAALGTFAKPRLALDAVGGESALRLVDALEEGGRLVVYGCMSGRAPTWPWQAWVFKGLKVSGFNLRKQLDEPGGRAKQLQLLRSLGKLVAARHLALDFTEYELASEWKEALEHAQEAGRSSKVLLRMSNSLV